NSTGISRIASGSRPAVQPSANFGIGGRSESRPFGAPPSTHATMVSICACERLRSLRILSVCAGSANQGGISRDITLFLLAFAHGRTSSYDVSVIGATSPLRWHATHLSYTIGATSLVKVGTAAAAAGPAASAGADIARLPSRSAQTRFMVPPQIADCGLRTADSADCGFSGLRIQRTFCRNPRSANRDSLAHFCAAHVGATIVTDVMFR